MFPGSSFLKNMCEIVQVLQESVDILRILKETLDIYFKETHFLKCLSL